MKTTSHLAAPAAALIALCGFLSAPSAQAQLIPAVPGGWLTAFPTMVQTGTKPTLTWAITYPSSSDNYTPIQQPATIDLSEDQLDVEIRVIGAGVTTGGCDGSNQNWVSTQAQLSYDGGSYTSIFYGMNTHVNPNQIVWAKRIRKGAQLKFGGRYYANNQWSQTYTSDTGTNNIRALKNGDFPPTAYPLDTSPALKSFMRPYLDGAGRIKIGPLDVLIMMELTQPDSNANSPCYEMQDMVLLVTARPKGNNGHGNNIDGVDVSNPGNGHGGPNGQVDPSGDVDDEKK